MLRMCRVQSRTDFGLPEMFERPTVCVEDQRSVSIFWFAPNPKTFGSASQQYHVQCKGDGKVRIN